MEPKRQRELLLAAVAVGLAAVAVWMLQSGRLPMPLRSSSTAPAANVAARGTSTAGDVNLTALGKGRPKPGGYERNPFRFRQKPPPPAPKSALPSLAKPADTEVAAGPAEPPPPPRIPLKYIGDMADPAAPGKRIAILSDGRGAYYGREGDIIEGRYKVMRIGLESIELAYLDGRGRQTIRQTGQ